MSKRPHPTPAARAGTAQLSTLGPVLLLHQAGRDTGRAHAFAAALAPDPGYAPVIVDLPEHAASPEWEAAAQLLATVPGIPRLLPGVSGRHSTVQPARLIADRLRRVVLGHDGECVPLCNGGLFIPAESGLGWMLCAPGEPPVPYTRRLPTPLWESAELARSAGFDGAVTVESLPAGFWIYAGGPTGPSDLLRSQLIRQLPADSRRVRIVVGFPQSPVPTPHAVPAKILRSVPAQLRPDAIFCGMGPELHIAGLGQGLADLLGEPVTAESGVPLVVPARDGGAQLSTLLPAGPIEWPPYALEFRYRPAPHAGVSAPDPMPLDARAPVPGLPEETPGSYRPAPDTILEIIRSGLWIHPAGDRGGAAAVWATPADPRRAVFYYTASDPGLVQRMRRAATEVLGRMDPQDRAACVLRTADVPQLAAPTAPAGRKRQPAAAPLRSTALVGVGPNGRAQEGTQTAGHFERRTSQSGTPAAVAAAPTLPTSVSAPSRASAPAEAGPIASVASPRPAQAPTALVESPPLPSPAMPQPAAAPASRTSAVTSPEPAARAESAEAFDLIRLVSGPETGRRTAVPVSSSGRGPGSTPATEPAPPSQPSVPPPRPAHVQPVPSSQATAVLPEGGIATERLWTRRNLRSQFDATASSVMRLLSETPGLRAVGADADAVTELVAARLYATGDTRRLDDAVRAAGVGPHVPLARCIASGLRRLPSYRGVARTCAELTDAEFQWYRENRRFTEWSFFPVLTTDRLRPAGGVELLFWCLTARRTGLIDPALPDQAVFLPGTAFKVLRADESAQRSLMLRELSNAEAAETGAADPAAGASPLDQMALAALGKAHDTWRRAGADAPEARYAERFSSPPGLIARLGSARATAVRARPATAAGKAQRGGSAPEGGAR
jgi:hypothetical protein